ncbi:hypothetical protein TWF506_009764 [Arthrobotrys conoides]|uniref:Uncharacterized protein n=1 Tax=Arthrobotrys conoides TaxID=74498 RepID=A0AAN8NJ63_9PEZI
MSTISMLDRRDQNTLDHVNIGVRTPPLAMVIRHMDHGHNYGETSNDPKPRLALPDLNIDLSDSSPQLQAASGLDGAFATLNISDTQARKTSQPIAERPRTSIVNVIQGFDTCYRGQTCLEKPRFDNLEDPWSPYSRDSPKLNSVVIEPSPRTDSVRWSVLSINDKDSVGTKASDCELGSLSLSHCIVAGIPFHDKLSNGKISSRHLEFERQCTRDVEDETSNPWVIQPGEFASRLRCPFAASGAGCNTYCLFVNARNLDGIRNHIKAHHPDFFLATLLCNKWEEIFRACFPKAKPAWCPSPYFDIRLVQEQYKGAWPVKRSPSQPHAHHLHGEGECSYKSVSSDVDIVEEPGSLFSPTATEYEGPYSRDFPEILSSLQAVWHVRLSLFVDKVYGRPFDGSSHLPWKVLSPYGGQNQQPYQAGASPFFDFHNGSGPAGGSGGQHTPGQDGFKDSDDEYDDGSEGGGKDGRKRDRKYPMRLACPLAGIGHPEFPCWVPCQGRKGRRYTGARYMKDLRHHIRTRHADIWSSEKLASILHPHTQTYKQLFCKLLDWPKTLEMPSRGHGSPSLYELFAIDPDREAKRAELYRIVQASRGLLPHLTANTGHQAAPEMNGQISDNHLSPTANIPNLGIPFEPQRHSQPDFQGGPLVNPQTTLVSHQMGPKQGAWALQGGVGAQFRPFGAHQQLDFSGSMMLQSPFVMSSPSASTSSPQQRSQYPNQEHMEFDTQPPPFYPHQQQGFLNTATLQNPSLKSPPSISASSPQQDLLNPNQWYQSPDLELNGFKDNQGALQHDFSYIRGHLFDQGIFHNGAYPTADQIVPDLLGSQIPESPTRFFADDFDWGANDVDLE